jgi:Holliday junction resolvase
MVRSYAKGATAERELVHTLSKLGYMTIRAPRSGRIDLPSPDVIAVKDGKVLVFEVKFRESAFTVRPEQLQELVEWRDKAKATTYLACKISRRGWKFLHLHDVLANNGNVGKKFLEAKGVGIETISN